MLRSVIVSLTNNEMNPVASETDSKTYLLSLAACKLRFTIPIFIPFLLKMYTALKSFGNGDANRGYAINITDMNAKKERQIYVKDLSNITYPYMNKENIHCNKTPTEGHFDHARKDRA